MCCGKGGGTARTHTLGFGAGEGPWETRLRVCARVRACKCVWICMHTGVQESMCGQGSFVVRVRVGAAGCLIQVLLVT